MPSVYIGNSYFYMELRKEDAINNKISVLLVIPRSNRLYDYYIDGLPDKRTMLQKQMLDFCVELCPDHAEKIRRCIYEILSFVIYINNNEFKELKENDPPKLNKKSVLFPMNELVKKDKIDFTKNKNLDTSKLIKNYSIWEQYQIHIDSKKRKTQSNNRFYKS